MSKSNSLTGYYQRERSIEKDAQRVLELLNSIRRDIATLFIDYDSTQKLVLKTSKSKNPLQRKKIHVRISSNAGKVKDILQRNIVNGTIQDVFNKVRQLISISNGIIPNEHSTRDMEFIAQKASPIIPKDNTGRISIDELLGNMLNDPNSNLMSRYLVLKEQNKL